MREIPVAEDLAFDPLDPGFTRDPHPTYARLRERAPVHWWEKGRAFLLTRYADTIDIQRDRRFSMNPRDWAHAEPVTAAEGPAADFQRLLANGLLGVAPAEHQRLRRLINPAFTPRAAARREADVKAIVERTLDESIRDGVIDVRRDYAEHIPIRVISHMLAIPPEGREVFRRFSAALLEMVKPFVDPQRIPGFMADFGAGRALLADIIEARRRALGDDLLSELVRIEEAGDRLSSDELEALIATIVIAGSDTTVHGLTFLVYNLLAHPDQLALLRADPSLVPQAIEESQRFNLFDKFGLAPRFALEDVELRGAQIAKGDMVQPLLPSAMRDPEAFERPDVFDMRRESSRMYVFGSGPHLCLGMHLARLELRLGLTALLERFGTWRLLDVEPEYLINHGTRDMVRLRIAVD